MPNFDEIIMKATKSKMGKKMLLKRTTAPSKPKRMSTSKVQKLLWVECKRIVRSREKDCYTCGAKELVGSNAQTGHFIPNSTGGAFLRYSLNNLRLQCMRCNIHGGGMGAEFYRRLVMDEGQAYVDQLFIDKNKMVKARDHYEALLEQYKVIHRYPVA